MRYIVSLQVTDRLMVKKFDELVVELLFRMHDAPSELLGGSQFLRFVKTVLFVFEMMLMSKFVL